MNMYEHSVYLDIEKCVGCTTCVKHCPTEAIRVKNGHAVINPDRCIDCGECVRVCEHHAKRAKCDSLADMDRFKWKIAMPAPSLYGQFEGLEDIDYVVQGLLDIGFDDVYEVSQAAELVSEYTRLYVEAEGIKKPVISSACPAVVRMIALRFPYLKDNLLPLLPPMEVAAIEARRIAKEKHPELKEEEIGVCFISPCPAKVSYVRNGFGKYKSHVDVVIPINEVYFMLINVMKRGKVPEASTNSGMIGISWATSGGEATAVFNDKYLAADGIDNVIKMLDEIEDGTIPPLDFIELDACTAGCVGGVMTMGNPFIAKARLQTLRRYMPVSRNFLTNADRFVPDQYFFEEVPTYRPISRLGASMGESMRMMADIQKLKDTLPGIDCASCGAPNCRAFAEDVVKGEKTLEECLVRRYQQKKGEEET